MSEIVDIYIEHQHCDNKKKLSEALTQAIEIIEDDDINDDNSRRPPTPTLTDFYRSDEGVNSD